MERYQISLNIERINCYIKQFYTWEYEGCGIDMSIFPYRPSDYLRMASEVREYAMSEPDDILLQQRLTALDNMDVCGEWITTMKSTLSDRIYTDIMCTIQIMMQLREKFYDMAESDKGGFYGCPEVLMAPKTVALLQRCVDVGYLDEFRKPTFRCGNTEKYLIAWAVIQILDIKKRVRWASFEQYWGLRGQGLARAKISRRGLENASDLTDLFPEVDFWKLINPDGRLFFNVPQGRPRIKHLYEDLKAGGYIDSSTTLDQFLGIFGKSKSTEKVNWTSGLNKLGTLVVNCFKKTNSSHMKISSAVFLHCGEQVDRSSLSSAVVSLKRLPHMTDFNLEEICHNFTEGF